MYQAPATMAMLLILFLSIVGCGSGGGSDQSSHGDSPSVTDAHQHGEEGPHGGHLIELGRNHKYHAELIENDEDKTVSVYILDANQKELAIETSSIVLNLSVAGENKTYELAAAGDRGGSPRFSSADATLFQAFEQQDELSGKLRATIEGVPYVGTIDLPDHAHDE